MPRDRAVLNEMLAPLRAKYLTHLREARQEIVDFLTACEKTTLTPEQRDAMRRRAHNLAGNGATYGFPDITERGRALENALDNILQADVLSPLAKALLTACDEAHMRPASMPPAPVAEQAEKQPEPVKKPLLLAADDDPIIRLMVTKLFSQAAEIITASNGKEALRLIEERRPDLVLLDDIMPEMTGRKLLEVLRGNPELTSIPVVMLTASDAKKDVMHALMSGAADYITKPFNPDELFASCMRLLRHKRREG